MSLSGSMMLGWPQQDWGYWLLQSAAGSVAPVPVTLRRYFPVPPAASTPAAALAPSSDPTL